MLGLMQSQPLLISSLIEFAERNHGDGEIVSRRGGRYPPLHLPRPGGAPRSWPTRWMPGLAQGDRVATLAWNGYRHMEMYFGVSGSGRVLHTINPRLHPEQIAWIVNHAEDKVLCFDLTFLPLIQAVHANAPRCAMGGAVRCRQAAGRQRHSRPGQLRGLDCGPPSTTLAAVRREHRLQHVLHQRHHGQPQGRAVQPPLQHAARLCAALPDVMCLSARDGAARGAHVPRQCLGPAVFGGAHGLQAGLPGPALDGKSVYELIEAEGVTFAAGVPTVWQMLLAT
jgi:fatty-acyl-CoA synthase